MLKIAIYIKRYGQTFIVNVLDSFINRYVIKVRLSMNVLLKITLEI